MSTGDGNTTLVDLHTSRPAPISSLHLQINEQGEGEKGARDKDEQTALISFCCSFRTRSFNKAG